MLSFLFNHQDVCKACHFKNFHNRFINVRYLHGADLLYFLLCTEKNAKICAQDVFKAFQVRNKVFDVADILADVF